jgi:hypothetical protein
MKSSEEQNNLNHKVTNVIKRAHLCSEAGVKGKHLEENPEKCQNQIGELEQSD